MDAPQDRSRVGIVRPAGGSAQGRGLAAEALAERFLARHGVTTIARNVRCRGGEIDLVCLDHGVLAFVEVRLRSAGRFGGAGESITQAKQRRIVLAARWWLAGAGRARATSPCRFDAILLDALDERRLEWIKNAFGETST